MKQAADNQTMELPMPGAKRGRGRPATGTAMTNAQRQAAFKARRKANPAPQAATKVSDESERIQILEHALKAAQSRIEGLEKEIELLIGERAAAFSAAEKATAEIAKIKAGQDNSGKLASQVLRLEAALNQANADYDRMMHDMGKPTESEKVKHLQECYDLERSLRISADEKIKKLEAAAKRQAAARKSTVPN